MPRALTTIILLIALLLTGCFYYRPISSAYLLEEPGWSAKSGGDCAYGGDETTSVYSSNDSLCLEIFPCNYGRSPFFLLGIPFPADPGCPILDQFVVFIEFNFRKDQDYRLNPHEVYLTLEDGSVNQPSAYHMFQDDPLYLDGRLPDQKQNYLEPIVDEFITIKDLRAIAISYKVVPPSPEERFTLEIKGFQIDSVPVKVPKIFFRKHTVFRMPIFPGP